MKRSNVAQLPTLFGNFQTQAWYDSDLHVDHLTLSHMKKASSHTIPTVRIHSECLTGDVFGSYRCDCGEQLQASLKMIATTDGILIYLRGHEGRGIGLLNKIQAYVLQEKGRDTFDANLELGLPADDRNYLGAVKILKIFGYKKIKLLSNNPHKVLFLQEHGIDVVECIPLNIPPRKTNAQYLKTKKERMDHHLVLDEQQENNEE